MDWLVGGGIIGAIAIGIAIILGAVASAADPCANGAGMGSCSGYPLDKVYPVIAQPSDHAARALGNWQSDNAIDFGNPRGTSVLAVADGEVVRTGGSAPTEGSGVIGGYSITLKTSDNQFFYTHLLSVSVKAGDKVKQGQIMGKSGYANGVDHLHIGVEKGDPMAMWGDKATCEAGGELNSSWEAAVRLYSGSNYGVSHLQELYKQSPQQGRVAGDRAIVKEAAEKNGVPFALLWATYGAESSWGKARSYFGLTGDYPGIGTSGSFRKDANRSGELWARLKRQTSGGNKNAAVEDLRKPATQTVKVEDIHGNSKYVTIASASPVGKMLLAAASDKPKDDRGRDNKEDDEDSGRPANLQPLGSAPLPGLRRGIATTYFPSQGGINGNEGAGAYAQVYERGWGAARLGSAGGGVRNAWGLVVVKVTNVKNGKTVYVPIIDNGPGAGPIGGKPRIIDLLPPVTKALNGGKVDNLEVVIEPVGRISKEEADKYGRGEKAMGEGSPAMAGDVECEEEAGTGDGTIVAPPGIDVTKLDQVQPGEKYTTNSGTFTIDATHAKNLVWWQKGNVAVAKWMAPALLWARKNGWDGSLSNGFRTFRHQQILAGGGCPYGCASPGNSNHEKSVYSGGAIDANNPQQLYSVVKKYPGRPKLIWAPVSGRNQQDTVHFSADGG